MYTVLSRDGGLRENCIAVYDNFIQGLCGILDGTAVVISLGILHSQLGWWWINNCINRKFNRITRRQ